MPVECIPTAAVAATRYQYQGVRLTPPEADPLFRGRQAPSEADSHLEADPLHGQTNASKTLPSPCGR